MRDALVALAIAGLSFVLLAVSVAVVLKVTPGGQLDRDQTVLNQDYASVKAKYGDPWQLAEQNLRLFEYGISPTIAVMTGCLVGLFVSRRPGLLGLFAVIPFAAFMLAAHNFGVRGFLLAVIYLILAWTASTFLNRFRRPRKPVPLTT